jgi:hypothetical protein
MNIFYIYKKYFFIWCVCFLLQERERYKKLQYEKDREITVLTDEINKLKRDLDTQRADIDRLKRKQLDFHSSADSISTITSKSDDNTNG